jgi:hypothetical protein
MLPYIAYMDPMGYESNIITPMDFSGNVVCSGENDNKKKLDFGVPYAQTSPLFFNQW